MRPSFETVDRELERQVEDDGLDAAVEAWERWSMEEHVRRAEANVSTIADRMRAEADEVRDAYAERGFAEPCGAAMLRERANATLDFGAFVQIAALVLMAKGYAGMFGVGTADFDRSDVSYWSKRAARYVVGH